MSARGSTLLQAYQIHVSQNRLLEELGEQGTDNSAGQNSNILLDGHHGSELPKGWNDLFFLLFYPHRLSTSARG